MADKLAVWNQALIHLGQAPIAALNDGVLSVNVFNNAWDGVVEEAFNEGDWNFARATVEMSPATGTPSAGFQYVYDYPSDYERTVAVGVTALFEAPFYDFMDEGGRLHANIEPLFLRYIRNDLASDVLVWPTMFWRFVAVKLAYETCERITQSTTSTDKLERKLQKALRKAKSVDARNQPGQRLPTGSWNRARNGGGLGGRGSIGTIAPGSITLNEGDV